MDFDAVQQTATWSFPALAGCDAIHSSNLLSIHSSLTMQCNAKLCARLGNCLPHLRSCCLIGACWFVIHCIHPSIHPCFFSQLTDAWRVHAVAQPALAAALPALRIRATLRAVTIAGIGGADTTLTVACGADAGTLTLAWSGADAAAADLVRVKWAFGQYYLGNDGWDCADDGAVDSAGQCGGRCDGGAWPCCAAAAHSPHHPGMHTLPVMPLSHA